jgi:hypothetical protein
MATIEAKEAAVCGLKFRYAAMSVNNSVAVLSPITAALTRHRRIPMVL